MLSTWEYGRSQYDDNHDNGVTDMSRFYGTVSGQGRTEASRRGGTKSGLVTYAAGWGGAIKTEVYDDNGVDMFRVILVPWQNSGGDAKVLATGRLNCMNPSAEGNG